MEQGGFGQRGQDPTGRRGRRRAWQARLFPELVEPVRQVVERSDRSATDGLTPADHALRRRRHEPERANLNASPPRLTPQVRAWLGAIESDETRRAYRRDATFLMRRLGLVTDPLLSALERGDAVRYRDALQALVAAGACSAGLARRRMAAALSLYDHLQRQYLVPINPFAKLRRPRQDVGDGQAPRRPRRACGRSGCPLAVLGPTGTVMPFPPRRRSKVLAADGPHQLRLW